MSTPPDAGPNWISPVAWNLIADSLRLGPRELQVVQRVFDDKKNLAIAHELGISKHTVHTYLERIYRKHGVNSRVELVVRVMQEYLRQRGLLSDGRSGEASPA